MPYTKRNIDNGYEFNVQPEKAPSIAKILLPLLIIPLLLIMCSGPIVVIAATVIIGAFIYFMQKSTKYTLHRQPSSFTVTSDKITKQGNDYNKEDIHRIIIRNHVDEEYVFISNYQSYHNPASTAGALKLRQQLINVSYRVDIECGGYPTTLAGGINEPTAYALLSDISKVLDYKIS